MIHRGEVVKVNRAKYLAKCDALVRRAAASLYARGGGPWCNEMAPLNEAERALVRTRVAERITYDVDMRTRFAQ